MDINNLWSNYDLNSKKQNSRCLSVNTILEGKYLVGPVLGQGGFGITYVGYDLNMESKIAIKEYFPVELVSRDTTTMHGDRVLSLSGEKSVTYKAGLKKYVAEAQNVSQFSEVPGVVSVKDFFYANETAYIVMEFIDGISLKDYLKEKSGRLSEEETLAIMKPILEALVQVHKSGIIHRDISPDNIMLTFEDSKNHSKIKSVKLIDFGAARMTEKNDQKSLTIILKHGYAPEEQYRTHGEQGPWTDVYALCAVLYRMLTGETPVPAMDRMFKDELKTLEQCGAKVSTNTAAAILKGLAVKKDDRIQSMQELIAALYEGAKVNPIKAGKGTAKSGSKAMAIAAAVGVTICASIFAISTLQKEETGAESASAVLETIVLEALADPAEPEETKTSTVEEDITPEAEMSFIEDELGEQIVSYDPQKSIAVGRNGSIILCCQEDGTVVARGSNGSGACDVEYWTHVVQVAAGESHSLGLRSDGTVLAAGSDQDGQCEVDLWKDIVAIESGDSLSLGVTADGSVLYSGRVWTNDNIDLNELDSWSDIKAVEYAYLEQIIIGLKNDGTIVFTGDELDPSAVENWPDVVDIEYAKGQLIGKEADGTIHLAMIGELEPRETYYEDVQPMKYFDTDSIIGVNTNGEIILHRENSYYGYADMLAKLKTGTSGWNSAHLDQYGFFVGIKEDGTFYEQYMNTFGNAELEDFYDLKAISLVRLRDTNIIGQRENGDLLYIGCANGDSLREFCDRRITQPIIDIQRITAVGFTWLLEDGTVLTESELFPKENVVKILDNSNYDCVAFLMKDGSVQIHPVDEEHDKIPEEVKASVKSWKNMRDIWNALGRIYGLCEDGTIVCSSATDYALRFNVTEDTTLYFDNNCIFGLKENGSVELLHMDGDAARKKGKYQIDTWENIVDLSFGESHTVGLRADGTVVAVGANHCGQCDVEEWRSVVEIEAGGQCTIGRTADGKLLMAGSLY